jgi:hypothetical protein
MNKRSKIINRIGKKISGNYFSARIYYFLCKLSSYLISDKTFIELMYLIRIGDKLDLKKPKYFSEKIQWLKLNHRDPLLNVLVDKYKVKDYIKEKIGEEYLIPLLGVYDSFNQIDFNKLPDKFILKTNNGSGWIIPCPDKSKFNKKEAEKKINLWLKPIIIILEKNGHIKVLNQLFYVRGSYLIIILDLMIIRFIVFMVSQNIFSTLVVDSVMI